MTTVGTRAVSPSRRSASPADRFAFTLLEVLVALGIILVGLGGVMALLPASGVVLAEAGFADRAGTLVANGHADLRNRQMATSDQFQAGNVTMVVLGDVFPASPFGAAPFSRHARSGEVSYTLGDDMEMIAGDVPAVRSGGVCYGATIAPSRPGAPVVPGSPAVVSVAVFRKPGVEMKALSLQATGSGSGVFQVTGPATTAPLQDADRRRFMPGCSWVLASAGTQPPRWLQVGSSWATQAAGSTSPSGAFVAFSDAAAATALVGAGTTLTVYAFEGLLQLDERPTILQ